MAENQFWRQHIDPEKIQDTHKAKWSAEVLSEGFVPFPKKLLRCMHDTFPGSEGLDELAVVLAVADYKRPSLSRPPSAEYLAFVTNFSAERVTGLLKMLEGRGLLRITTARQGLEIDLSGLLTEIQKLTREADMP